MPSPPPPHRLPPKPFPLAVNSKNGGHRPNYVIFMPDQLRYDSLGCTATTPPDPAIDRVRTPHIDAFRQRATLFTNCFTQASVCSQSRVSMFTGQYPHVAGHRSLENLIKPWEPNLFRSLKDEGGYHIACLAPRGDTFAPEVTELSLNEYGFLEMPDFVPPVFGGPKKDGDQNKDDKADIWARLFYNGERGSDKARDYDDALVRSALAWLECPPADKPWVLFMPLLYPHCPFTVEEPWFSMYDRNRVGDPAGRIKTGHEPRYMAAIRDTYGTDRATPDMWREVRATYYGMISRLDAQFGRVVAKLDELDLWRDTVTMFFTDHGEYLGDHGLIEKWPSGLSESLVREPLLVGGAGLPQNATVTAMAEMVDLVPTMLEISGVGEHFPHNGVSWVPLLLGKEKAHKAYAFSEGGFLESEEPLLENSDFPYDLKSKLQHDDVKLVGKAISMRDEKWTYVYRLFEPAELYSRTDDPHELHNLTADPEQANRVAEMERAVLRWLVEGSDFLPWTRDVRFPEVKLPSPREQLEERKRAGCS
ncbi:hypothetical protein MAPG_11552 [Magnaporthiopsis poae ATCC 64411]|uniref:Sulfatase N-terminal domain-containing protein n=1 Tax=Magnaporthiopsis poae (strain ATCC 64411 / 73-15) TaxID=644358 RepID=A0A0C4EFK1_MAGP6|nr:hypothetical protein MAPG_11552 [Magnaporthiopsis poae ATCC 64411]